MTFVLVAGAFSQTFQGFDKTPFLSTLLFLFTDSPLITFNPTNAFADDESLHCFPYYRTPSHVTTNMGCDCHGDS